MDMIETLTTEQATERMRREKTGSVRRAWRILRLRFLTAAFAGYLHIDLKRRLLESKNTWKSAEEAKALAEFLFPEKEVKTEDFIHDKNALSDEIIDRYGDLKRSMGICCPILGIPERAVVAFCRHERANRRVFLMAETDCAHYDMYLRNLYLYVNGQIGKDELKNGFFETSIFRPGKHPANLARFRRSMIRAEILLDEIMEKQDARPGGMGTEDGNQWKIDGAGRRPFF
jgi:hypothetical protein